jgi:hypothetical protein
VCWGEARLRAAGGDGFADGIGLLMTVVKSRSSLRLAAGLSAFLQSATALLFHGLILCVGPQGHTAVEWFAAADCCASASAFSLGGDRCCDCTDAPLLQPIVDKRDVVDMLPTASVSALIVAPPCTDHPCSVRLNPRVGSPPDALSARRTVVLQS